jgi:hypothetical protein
MKNPNYVALEVNNEAEFELAKECVMSICIGGVIFQYGKGKCNFPFFFVYDFEENHAHPLQDIEELEDVKLYRKSDKVDGYEAINQAV